MIPGNQASGGKFIDPPSAITSVVGAGGTADITITHTGYKGKSGIVTYRVTASNGVTATTSSTTVSMLAGLTPGQTYTFSAVAIESTSGAESVSSSSSSPLVLGSVPSAPLAPTATLPSTYGNTTASVAWIAPASVGSSISDYTVQYSSNSGSTWTTFSRAASTATSVTVTGLTNGTAYVFRVNAINGIGAGSYSSSSSSVTPLFGKVPTPIVGDIAETESTIPWCYTNYFTDDIAQSTNGGTATYNYYGFNVSAPNDQSGSCHGWTGLGYDTNRYTYVYVSKPGWANSDAVYIEETTNPAPPFFPYFPFFPFFPFFPTFACPDCPGIGPCCPPAGCGGFKDGFICI